MKIDAVIVTYNRLTDLKKCLEKYDEQILNVDSLIVVNNCSNDGTEKFLYDWKNKLTEYKKVVLNLPDNLGGSGGFAEGLKYAMKDGADWIWLHDDDAFVYEDTILNLKKSIEKNECNNVSAICGMVYDQENIAIDHRRIIKRGLFKNNDKCIDEKKYKEDCFELNEFSYVGVAINVNKLFKVGITNTDFFIFLDDTEHSYRLSRIGKILCYPKIRIRHDNKYQINDHIATWKLYYSIRNNIYFSKYCIKGGLTYWIIYFYLTAIFKRIVRKDKIGAKLVLDAIKDGLNAKMGKNEIYKPGWKSK